MVEYITISDLKEISRNILSEDRRRILREARDRSPNQATFLSHSTKDEEHIAAVVRVLESHGALVYIDKKDETLPPYTTRETAKILRSRIQLCKKFIMFATKNSKDSRWVPWELGLSDGYKLSSNTAIFPTVNTATDTKWAEQEYLGVYDRIVFGALAGYENNVWMVWNQEANTATALQHWLKQ